MKSGMSETRDCQANAEADSACVNCRCLAAATVRLEAPSPHCLLAAHPACLSARAAAAPAVAAVGPVAAAPLAVAAMAALTSATEAQETAMGSLV